MAEKAKPVVEAGKPLVDPGSTTGAAATPIVATAGQVKRRLLAVVVFLVGIAVGVATPVVSHVIINRIDPPVTDQERDRQKQTADALWGRYSGLSDEVQQWRQTDMQDYRDAINRLVKDDELRDQWRALLNGKPGLNERLDLAEANQQELLNSFEDLLASSKRAIPISRGLVDKLALLERDAGGFNATTEDAKNKQALVKTEAAKLRVEIIAKLKHQADFLTGIQVLCKGQVNSLKKAPAAYLPPNSVLIEDKQRIERFKERCSRLQDGWNSVSGQALALSDSIFPYVLEWQKAQGR